MLEDVVMSYSCYISFKKIKANEIISFFRDLKVFCTSKLEEIAKQERSYCPFIRGHINVERDWSKISRNDIREAVEWAKTSVFQFKYFYDEKHGYLGVFGVPDALHSKFDGTVYFQNSCDQNYSRKSWEGIPLFETIYDKWMQYSDNYIKRMYFTEYGNPFTYDYPCVKDSAEKLAEKLLYYRETFAYQEIWAMFSSYLYAEDDAIFCSFYGPYEEREMRMFIKYCHSAQVQWEDDFEREWNLKHGIVKEEK